MSDHWCALKAEVERLRSVYQKVDDETEAEAARWKAEVELTTDMLAACQSALFDVTKDRDRFEAEVERLEKCLLSRGDTALREEVERKESDRQYHMNAINRLAEAIGMLGETSDAIAEAMLSRVAKLACMTPVYDATVKENARLRKVEEADGGGSEMKTIWVVGGSSGEYSDHREWFICYYTDEAKAKAHAEAAAQRYRALKIEIGEDPECGMCWSGPQEYCPTHKHLKNEWDPNMQPDSSGVNYYAFDLNPWNPVVGEKAPPREDKPHG